MPNVRGPRFSTCERNPSATRSSASSQLAARCLPFSRINGVFSLSLFPLFISGPLCHSKESHKGPDMNNGNRERLKTPLIRENGRHRAASWDEALDRVADGFRSQVEKRGPRTFGMFSCSKTTNELNYVAQKFVRSVIGTNNIDSCNRT